MTILIVLLTISVFLNFLLFFLLKFSFETIDELQRGRTKDKLKYENLLFRNGKENQNAIQNYL
jgi:hypothetical protein